MGFSDLFNSVTSAAVPPPVPPKSEADLERNKDEIVRRLTQELVETRQRNHELEQRQDLQEKTRKEAVARVRELEDVIALKNSMFDTLERQLDLLEKHTAELQRKEAELVALRAEQAEQPISANDLAHRYAQLSDLFTQLQDTLTCPVCYEPFGRGQAVSLQCGHTFCQPCYSEWEQRSVEAFKISPLQGAYLGPECPECRTADVRRGRVRIYSLEEVVRLVERGKREIAAHPYTPADIAAVEPVAGAQLLRDEVRRETGSSSAVEADPPSGSSAEARSGDMGHGATPPLPQVEDAISLLADAGVEEARRAETGATADPPAPTLVNDPTPDVDMMGTSAQTDSMTLEEHSAAATPEAAPLPSTFEPTGSSAPPPPLPALPSPDASRLSVEEAYFRERAAARARAQEEERRLEAEAAARRAEEEEREAREAREQVLVERGRRPYAGGAVVAPREE